VFESNGAGTMIRVSEKPTTPSTPTTPTTPTTPITPTTPTTPTIPTTPTTPTTPSNPGSSDSTENKGNLDNGGSTQDKEQGQITLNATKINLQKGKTIKTLSINSSTLEGDDIVSVVSSNTKVLKASCSGNIITLKGAKTNNKYVTVTVTTESGATASCQVKVVKNAVKTSKVILNEKSLNMDKGSTAKLTVTQNPISATDKITYKTSNKKIATVDKNGKIKAKKKGKATITVTSANGKKATCKVTVK
jgi:hypothetical protein